MIRWLGSALSRHAARWVPDPFAIAVGLTLLTMLLVWTTTPHGPSVLLGWWGGRLDEGELVGAELGFWRLLAFSMQMCLILVTGFALASAPPVRAVVRRIADLPRTPAQAVATTAVVAMLCAYVNWGLGLIIGALLARDVALSARSRGIRVHYPLLGAAGYAGLMVWHGGLSGTAPFKVTQLKDLTELFGATPPIQPIALGETVGSLLNVVTNGLLLVAVPLILVRMLPHDADIREIAPDQATADLPPDPAPAAPTPAERLERSRALAWAIGAAALVYLWIYLSRIGVQRADLNAINLFFLATGLILHASPRAYGNAIAQAAGGCAGIILQFPFYAGIMALMTQSGLSAAIAEEFAEVAGTRTYPLLTFLSAGLVNLFVPSGGGQWAVQGPVVLASARALDVDPGAAIMAFAYGDGWTNMLQPFWALPLLAITGLQARHLIGYTAALMFLVLPIYGACLLLIP